MKYERTTSRKIRDGLHKVVTNPIGFGLVTHLVQAGLNAEQYHSVLTALINPASLNQTCVTMMGLYALKTYDKAYNYRLNIEKNSQKMYKKE